MIHSLKYRRTNHHNVHVRGYKEEGTITTPFDMSVLNDLDRFHLAGDAIDRLPQLGARAAYVKQLLTEHLIEHRSYIRRMSAPTIAHRPSDITASGFSSVRRAPRIN